MTDELTDAINHLNEIDKKIDQVSKQWIVLKHEYRSTKNTTIRQKQMDSLEKKRRKIIEQKNEIEFKKKWKGWK